MKHTHDAEGYANRSDKEIEINFNTFNSTYYLIWTLIAILILILKLR
jgi:hypothetical protein